MYNFEDKDITTGSVRLIPDLRIYNKDYIPFSLLFNLNSRYKTLKAIINYYSSPAKLTYIDSLSSTLNQWLDDIPSNFNLCNTVGSELISKITVQNKLYFKMTRFRRRSNYIKGYYTLFSQRYDRDYGNYVPDRCFYMLVIKRTHIRIAKLCILLNEPILDDCFEFWYDQELIDKDPIAPKTTKRLIKELSLIDVPCINKSNIMDLFSYEVEFKAPTISRQKELLEEFVTEFQKEELKY